MVKINQDSFLSFVSKFGKNFDKNGTLRISIKRDLTQTEPSLRKPLRNADKQKLFAQLKTKLESEPEPLAPLVVRAGNKKSSFSTQVDVKKVNTFSNQLSNIVRLFCFDQSAEKLGIIKQIRKPTQPDLKSKRTQKSKEKKRRNKERRIKQRQISKEKRRNLQRQKTFATKQQKMQVAQQ